MPLTDAMLRAVKPADRPQKLFDGGGLFLLVPPTGGRWWRLKYRVAGREKLLSLGTYPEISLKVARERREDARRMLDRGEDPGAVRREAKTRARSAAASTFEAVARQWLAHRAGAWEEGTQDKITASLEADAFPLLGARPISEIKAMDVAAVAKRIEARGAGDMAARVLQRCRSVFRYAVMHEIIDTDPTAVIKPAELLKARQVTHRAALTEKELPTFLAKLDAYDGDPATCNALRLLMLTAVRPGELRGALWAEFDEAGAVWRIPAARMKMRTEHVVPLSAQALKVLADMRPLSGSGALVFPSPFYPGKSLSENTLNSALARMGYKGIATAHGMRSLFSTVANECGHDPDVIERQLAHIERNQVRAAYHRAAYLEDRAKLMQWWADYMDGKRAGQVIPLHRTA